ncbi:MAG: ADP-ribosyl-[dinitrogen reductase] hydrolase [Candidatus Thiodiazotropha sp. (ex Lucina aurantia)]|uniref:ADP-ribosyl-[dinitrogen reductase] glycohydrolase n=1 Tax=Candidatus Thiodiazotropha endolucinida TaxID=1655433 RepID=A0A7Z1AF36_9GAMM|nr:ADP-ribosyl-[dinitrogen reductase] hydrolase [Candidatus Thiodiazotropha sp. (ex Lucina pensylvanica)]MBT3014448.1 ADP-ribosyl-[dinitrogen reductase] hydrolase [Candidatus Thiodiazotropha taylori]MBV2097892.1 ADP-ribosyl-[dinitrogen reductase] hydrolase [Candidatus Thiodiazotropha sp. (ex Codakia orbicularis)]MBV2103235.1 ADP-ribosyl-[dinitrogen reductase] hydrolase [Candidatus Thiodiazotropha sp. (ex Lucina aurantia)]MCG7861715.1 ADP-ribosyl-[dinitrogen reductase] hydrolase [Candidatus Thio
MFAPDLTARHVAGKDITLEQRAFGAYLGLAVGDALGATTEFLTPREIREKHGVHDRICGGGWLRLKPGQVTDDTEMSLALGQSIIESGKVEAKAVAEAFSQWMRGKPVDIGNTVRRGIVHYRNSGETSVPENKFDAGNGACMRSLPVAIAYWNAGWDKLFVASRTQSHITHHNGQADAGTEALLQMLCMAFKNASKQALFDIANGLVENHRVYRFDRRQVENPSGWIVETLQAVFQSFFNNDDFESVLVDVVNRGGDADTTGAIAGMLAGAFYGVDAIPGYWLKALNKDVKAACHGQTLALLKLADMSG